MKSEVHQREKNRHTFKVYTQPVSPRWPQKRGEIHNCFTLLTVVNATIATHRDASLAVQEQGMLGLKMAAEVDLALEGAAAGGAGERFEAGVLAAVGDEVGALAEGLATLLALVGFLSWQKENKSIIRLR